MASVDVAMAWSGGKDAALALHRLRQRDDITVTSLVTTVSAEHDRVSIHGVRRGLLVAQADRLDIPLHQIDLPPDYGQDDYSRAMEAMLDEQRSLGVDAVAYADIFLEEVRTDRERQLQDAGLDGMWPLWGEDTQALAEAFIDAGFEAFLVCVDGDRLDRSFAGRRYDRELLEDLPSDVDPCGENGAFHTFVVDGPGFSSRLAVDPTGVVTRAVPDGDHHYCALRREGGR